jgi:hypothetical protein
MVAVGGLSLLTLLVSVVAVPWLCCRLPSDYLDPGAPLPETGWARRVLRNVLGSLLLLAGALMLVLPGQGLLTLLLGLTLVDFPGKRRFMRRLLMRPRVLRVINALRRRFNVEPLQPGRRDSEPSQPGP